MNMLQDFTHFLDVERHNLHSCQCDEGLCLSTSLKGIIWRQLTDASVYCTLMKFGKYVYEMIFLFVLLIKSRLGEGEGNQK